jgi:two-component system KDP operon response regulator KdpE
MNTQPHILVIDDEPQIAPAHDPDRQQFRVSVAAPRRAWHWLPPEPGPDHLDLSLPDMDGVEVCNRLREWTQVPVIVLSVRGRAG